MNHNKKLTHATSFGSDKPGKPNDKLSAAFTGPRTATGKSVVNQVPKKQPGSAGGTQHKGH